MQMLGFFVLLKPHLRFMVTSTSEFAVWFCWIPFEEWEERQMFHVGNRRVMWDRMRSRKKGAWKASKYRSSCSASLVSCSVVDLSLCASISNAILIQCKILLVFVIGIN